MKKVFITIFFIIIIFVFPLGTKAAASDIVFSEIMYDLAGADADHEWVEIYNAGSEPVTIVDGAGDNSWRFNESSANHTFTLVQGSLTVPAGGVAVLAANGDVFLTDHPSFSGTLIDTVMSLGNTSETLKLSADKGATFFGEVTYQNTWGGNGDGKSLEKINLGGNNDQSNWRASTVDGGTPGVVNVSSAAPISTATSTATTTVSGAQGQSASSGGGGGGAVASVPILKAVAGSDVIIEAGKPIGFNGLNSQGASSYKWYLGDGSVKDGAEITYTYQFPGVYLVTLEVGNGSVTATDQLRVFVFGDKAFISEFFIGNASTTGQWVELANPNKTSIDMSNWILESGGSKFVLPSFVLISPEGYLALPQNITGLDLSRSNSLQLEYPNGMVVDSVSFENNLADSSANRSSEGFFWSKEMTPGRQNIILSAKLNSIQNPVGLNQRVFSKPAPSLSNLVASTYSQVVQASPLNEEADFATASQVSFWQKISGNFFFWIFSTLLLGSLVSFLYLIYIRRKII